MGTRSGAWRLLGGTGAPGAADGATLMATDAALLAAVARGAAPAVRLYRWSRPTLSFGRNQPAAGLYDAREAAARGIDFVRRPTGGQAVLHDDELTYAVIAPVGLIGKPRAAYRRINEGLVAGLRRLGVEAVVADGGDGPGPGATDWTAACFRHPAAGEVVVGGRKLVGSAQRCEGGVILQHGSILVAGSQAPAEELLLAAAGAVAGGRGADGGERGASRSPGWTTLEAERGGRPGWSALAGAIAAGFAEVLGTALAPGEVSVEESTRARKLRATFASPEWTWRR